MFESTEDLDCAHTWAQDLLGEKNVAKYYISKENFVAAYKFDDSFSFIVKAEPFYGHLYSPTAHLDERCSEIAVLGKIDSKDFVIRGGGFQFWEVETKNAFATIELLSDEEEITALIQDHAPDSSVLPGDPEEVLWGGIRNQSGKLIACAAVVKWQSGFHVMASVVTHSEYRGRGFGTALSRGTASRARELGIPLLGLGVRTGNTAAQRAYANAGFKELGAFTNYSRV